MARILVVDDERSIRNTFEVFLKKDNHSVLLAEDASKAIDMINKNEIDIILTDIVMPKITGLELLETVNEKIADIPVIIMTGEPTLKTARKAVKENAFDYLIKPISKDQLLTAVDNALGKKELIDKKRSLEVQNNEYRHKLEDLLHKRTEALEVAQKIVELSPTPTLIINLKSNKVFSVNKAMLEFMGLNDKKDVGKYKFFESNDTYKDLEEKLSGNGKVDKEEVQIYKNGTTELVWCLISIYPIEISRDKLHIISFTDINNEIEVQNNLRLAKTSAESVVLSSPIPIGIGDIQEKRNLVINESMKKLMKINDISQYSPMDIFTTKEDKEHIMTKLNNEGKVENVEMKINTLGSIKPQILDVLLSLQPIYYNNKECLIMSIIDLSDIKEAQKLLEAAKNEAEKAAKVKSQFLANMSHEIRTPINAIIGLNELLNNTQLTNKQKDYSNKIGGSSKILLKLINDILDFSKIESGKLNIEETKFNIDNLLSQVKDNVSVNVHEKDIEFILDVSENVPKNMIGDPLRIEQVLLNLTNNAIKFTQQGEVILEVDCIEDYENLLTLKFSVKDTGIGMTQDQAENLFKPFTQADISTTRKYGGTGLGLVISKNLVEMMGGSIEVNTELNKGSEFTFTAKVYKVSDVEKKNNKKIDMPECFLKANILVVIENNYTRNVFYKYLSNLGNKPKLLSCGEEAITELRDNKYDLVIMDCKMRGLGGVESWHIIKDMLGEENVPKIIIVTAYGTQDLFEAAESEHIDQVLVKPVTQSKLYDSIIELSCDEINNEYKIKSGYSKIENDTDNKDVRILLVEDNEINQQVAKELLELKGYCVDLANNGNIAIDKLRINSNYNIILMDLQMPVMDGYEATRKIRSNKKYKNIPIVALSADAMKETIEAALKLGMDDYITKPINHDLLYKKLSSLLKKANYEGRRQIGYQVMQEKDLIDLLPNINVKDGLNRINNNIDLYIKVLKKFRVQYLCFSDEVTSLIKNGFYDDARRQVHTLKGVSATIGAMELNSSIKDLEKLLKKENISIDEIESVINIIEIQLISIDKELTSVIGK